MKAKDIYDLALAGLKIQAIKELRQAGQMGLKEAKDVIDQALVDPTPAQGVNRIAQSMGQAPYTIVPKRTVQVRDTVGVATFVASMDEQKLVIGDANNRTVSFSADMLHTVIEALGTLVQHYPAMA